LLLIALQLRGPRLPGERLLPEAFTRHVHAWGQTSYALFLVHFPVLMLTNAAFEKWLKPHEWLAPSSVEAVALLLVSWLVSMLLANLFEHWVEAPLNRWGYRRHRTP